MATSTEESVRQVIVDALKAITQTDLEFDSPSGNVKDYLLSYEAEELKTKYLTAQVSGKRKVRCWAVDVRGNDDWYAAGNITKRVYTINIEAYYSLGVDGEGVKAMIKHARKVRSAIKGLTSTLSGTVDIVRSTGEIEISQESGTEAEGSILVGRMVYQAERVNPSF